MRLGSFFHCGALALCLACGHALALGSVTCDLAQKQSIERWPFDIVIESEPVTWSAEKTAKELLTAQSQYFSNKSSPFLRSVVSPTLSFYNPGITMTAEHRVAYSRTVDGRFCATVVGVSIKVAHRADIMLAKELVERSCVAREAMSYQLKHHHVALEVLKELQGAKDKIKANVFEVYRSQGAAGANEREVAESLKMFQKQALAKVGGILNPYIRQRRAQMVETPQALTALAQSCSGQFEQATELAKKQ